MEAVQEAETILNALEKSQPYVHLLTEEEQKELSSKVATLRATFKGNDPRRVRTAMDELNQAGRKLASIAMDQAMATLAEAGSEAIPSEL